MLVFSSANKGIQINFEENEEVQLCSRCSTPNSMQSGYCIDCDGPLQTPRTRYLKAREIIRCSVCGRFNSRDDSACSNRACLAELVKNDCTQKVKDENRDQQCVGAPPIEYVKVCPDCNHVNQPSTSECTACGSSLDFVDEEPRTQCVAERVASIVNVATHAKAKLEKGICYTIGTRNYLAEQLQLCGFVSGKHVEVTWDGAQFLIVDVSRNGTYINGRRLEPNREIVVPSGTVIGLGDASPSQPLAAYYRLEDNAN